MSGSLGSIPDRPLRCSRAPATIQAKATSCEPQPEPGDGAMGGQEGAEAEPSWHGICRISGRAGPRELAVLG